MPTLTRQEARLPMAATLYLCLIAEMEARARYFARKR